MKPHNSALGTPADTATPTATLTDTPTATPTDRTWSNRNSPTDPHSNKKVLVLISFKSPPHPPSVAVLSVRKSHSMPGPPAFETDSSVSQQPIYLKPFNTMIHRKNNKMALKGVPKKNQTGQKCMMDFEQQGFVLGGMANHHRFTANVYTTLGP